MKPIDPQAFDRKQAEAAPLISGQDAYVIRAQMNRSDWLILGSLALIWGGAFFFIGVAVRHVPPLTYVWLRLTNAASAMCGERRSRLARDHGVGEVPRRNERAHADRLLHNEDALVRLVR